MKYIDEYRDPARARGLLEKTTALAQKIARPVTLMEVCGSHTNAIGHHGIRNLLPENVRLISGPGCPVCVTATRDIDRALYLAGRQEVIFMTFGDMLKVPGTDSASLQQQRAGGGDIRIVASPMDCLRTAAENPDKQIVFMGIGFETTAPGVAATIRAASSQGLANFSVYSVHKVMPPAIRVLLDDPQIKVDGFICPGHVSTITGEAAYAMIPADNRAAVITGFEPVDIIEGIYMLLNQLHQGRFSVENQYARGVNPQGNPKARALMDQVFEPADAAWRGLGIIPGSGLKIRSAYAACDAAVKFEIPDMASSEPPGCRCGDILRGIIAPADCPLFRKICTPLNPIGPCMVSAEGTCAAHYKYS